MTLACFTDNMLQCVILSLIMKTKYFSEINTTLHYHEKGYCSKLNNKM